MPGVYKKGKCPSCGKSHKVSEKDIKDPTCKKCGEELTLGKNYYIWYSQFGEKFDRCIGPQIKQARLALSKVELNIAENRANLNKRKTYSWKDARKKFISFAETTVSSQTLYLWNRTLDLLEGYLDPKCLDDVTLSDVQSFVTERSKVVGPSTVNDHITCIKRMWNMLERWDMVENNKIRLLEKLTEPDGRERYLTDKEIDKLLSECKKSQNKMCYMIVLTALHTGLRKSDILNLKRSHFDLEQGVIRTEIKKKKKNKKLTIPMAERLRKEIRAHLETTPLTITGYIFPSPRDKMKPMVRSADLGYKDALKRAGIQDFTFHDLRHTFATLFLKEIGVKFGKDTALRVLQEILGHTNPKMTQRYAHILNKYLTEAMEGFEIKSLNS